MRKKEKFNDEYEHCTCEIKIQETVWVEGRFLLLAY